MAQKFYSLDEVAELLGISKAEVNQMRERQQLHGYRDGADWKFKAEDVDKLSQQPQVGTSAEPPEDLEEVDKDVVLSEVELGQSDPGASGTVISPADAKGQSEESDIRLAGSDLKLGGSGVDSDLKVGGSHIDPAGDKPEPDKAGSSPSGFDDLDLTLDEDLTLEDSKVPLAEKKAEEPGGEEASESGDSAVDLTAGLDDDDLVLGGSGSGSDITIGGDSGISLVDPADSGLSLEEPLELTGGVEESLELGEDDMISLSQEPGSESPTQLKTDGDFLLTPMDEGTDAEDSESGSQVIALDTEVPADDAATMIAGTSGASMPPMLDEELGAEPALGMETAPLDAVAAAAEGAPLGAPQELAGGQPLSQSMVALPEAPYSVWNVLSLALCVIFLTLTGMMMYDLLRNMWSWDSPYSVNSSLMDGILSMFEK